MVNNVKSEIELYTPMMSWLDVYLADRYKGWNIKVIDSHARNLDAILDENGVLSNYPQTIGLGIQIDVLGILRKKTDSAIVFIEAKKTQLTLHSLGQLWAYCKLCDPKEAFLLSSAGLGSLSKILTNLGRTDLLDFGDGETIKKMKVGKWDVDRGAIDYFTLIPKQ